jgi:hypothetical protein
MLPVDIYSTFNGRLRCWALRLALDGNGLGWMGAFSVLRIEKHMVGSMCCDSGGGYGREGRLHVNGLFVVVVVLRGFSVVNTQVARRGKGILVRGRACDHTFLGGGGEVGRIM